jgi:hypothetical protein
MCLTSWARVSCRISLEADCQIKFLQICSVPLQNVRSTLRLAETRPSVTFSDLQWPSVLIAICKLSSTRSTCSDLHRPRWTMHLCVCVRVLLNILLNHVFAQYGERVATPGERKQSAWPEFDSWSVGGQLLHVWRSQGLEVKYQPAPFSYEALQRTFKFWLQVVVWFLLPSGNLT